MAGMSVMEKVFLHYIRDILHLLFGVFGTRLKNTVLQRNANSTSPEHWINLTVSLGDELRRRRKGQNDPVKYNFTLVMNE